uniref:(northern house mosquito) hypothetical protein n=1 Tax=Culex pipiens TaxID=7175 RepID=A0A8D8A3P2_CULPI
MRHLRFFYLQVRVSESGLFVLFNTFALNLCCGKIKEYFAFLIGESDNHFLAEFLLSLKLTRAKPTMHFLFVCLFCLWGVNISRLPWHQVNTKKRSIEYASFSLSFIRKAY